MEKLPVQYGMIYQSIEEEIINLSYIISFDEKQKEVYSTHIGELELRLFTLMESVIKTRAKSMQKFKESDLNKIKYEEIIKEISKSPTSNIIVVLESYNFHKTEYNDIFEKKESRISEIKHGLAITETKQNYKFNNAYQNLRHDFLNSLSVIGTLEYLFEALAVVYELLGTPYSSIFSVEEKNEKGEKYAWISNGSGTATRHYF